MRQFVALLFGALALGSSGCGREATAGKAAPGDDTTHLVAKGAFRSTLLLTGSFAAERAQFLDLPATSAWELQLRWIEADGTQVAAGAKVAEFDAGELVRQLEERRTARLEAGDELVRVEAEERGRLEEGELLLARAQGELERATIDAEVPKELLAGRDASERELALARASAEHEKAERELGSRRARAEAAIGVARSKLAQTERALAEAGRGLDAMALVTPVAGVLIVGEHPWEGRKLQPGDQIWPGFTVASIPDLASLYVVADLWDVDQGRVAPGMEIVAVVDAFPGESIPGRVRAVAPMARETDRRALRRGFRVEVALDRLDPARYRPGMSVRVEVVAEDAREALLIPRAALRFDGEGAVTESGGELVRPQLGACSATACVVEAGLAERDGVRRPEEPSS